jgi:hypothetical protein
VLLLSISLPWQGIEAGNHRQTHEMIKDMKIATSPEVTSPCPWSALSTVGASFFSTIISRLISGALPWPSYGICILPQLLSLAGIRRRAGLSVPKKNVQRPFRSTRWVTSCMLQKYTQDIKFKRMVNVFVAVVILSNCCLYVQAINMIMCMIGWFLGIITRTTGIEFLWRGSNGGDRTEVSVYIFAQVKIKC